MSDSALQTKEKRLTSEPAPLFSSSPSPLSSPMSSPPFATPSYLMTPMPGPFAYSANPPNMSYAPGRQKTEAAKPAGPPPTLAEAKAKYAAEAKWGAPPETDATNEAKPTAPSLNQVPAKNPEQPKKAQSDEQDQAKAADENKKKADPSSQGDATAPSADAKKEDNKKGKKGGVESAAEREKKFQDKQEDQELAAPFTPLPVPAIESGAKRLYPIIVQLPPVPRTPNIPQKLDVKPTGDVRKIPAQFADYESEFASTSGIAKGLYDVIVSEGRVQSGLAMQQLGDIQANAQTSLDRNLALLDQQLIADQRKLYLGEREALHRLELVAETSRMLVRAAAASVLGTVAARKATMVARTTEARSSAKAIHTKLAGFKNGIDTSGNAASVSFKGLASNPKPGRLDPEGGDGMKYAPEGPAAMNESPPMDPVIIDRANNRAVAYLNGVRVFGLQMDTAIKDFQAGEKAAFAPFQSYITMLGTTAPRQVRQMRGNAIKAIDRTEKRARRTIKQNCNRTEIGLVEKHKVARAQTVSQAHVNSASQARNLERGAAGQAHGYAMLARSQGQAITALMLQIAGQKAQQPATFAQFATQAAKRTAATTQKVAANRIAVMALSAAKSRVTLGQRATQSDLAQEKANDKLALQLESMADQAVTAMMRNMLQQENMMRQSAEPIASSVDNYKIPAKKEADEMESALWVALLAAQQQANQAYYGGGKPGKSDKKSTDEAAPPGVGELPHKFVENAGSYTTKPESEAHLLGMTKSIGNVVLTDFMKRGQDAKDQMCQANDPLKTVAAVRGVSALRAAAIIKFYSVETGGRNLVTDGKHYIENCNFWKAESTLEFQSSAFVNYLNGDRKAGALAEMQAAVNYSNTNEQLIAAAKALPPADMAALQADPKAAAIMNEVQSDLDDNHANAFKILREVTPENAVQKVAEADAILLTASIKSDLQDNPDQEKAGDAVAARMKGVQAVSGNSALAGHDEFGLTLAPATLKTNPTDAASLPAEYVFLSDEEKKAATTKSWATTVAKLGTDGKAPADGKPSGLDWLSQTLTEKRTYGDGEHTYEASLRKEHVKLITQIAKSGPGDIRVQSWQMVVEETRPGGADLALVGGALRDDEGNETLGNPDEPDAKKKEDQQARKAKGDARSAEMLKNYHYFSQGIDDEKTIADKELEKPVDVNEVRTRLGQKLKANAKDKREGELMELQVTKGVTNDETAALAFEHAVDRAGTNEQLLKDTFGAMSKEQIKAAVEKYDATHTPGLYARLGIFEEGGMFTELSGDDAIDIQILAKGIPRNERERFEKSHMTSKLQMKNASDAGKTLAGDEYKSLNQSHKDIMKKVGVKESDFDKFGELKRGADGKYMGKWNSDGSFAPAARDSAGNLKPGAVFDSLMFGAALSSNEAKAESFKIAVDNIASSIVTAIIVATAIITTIVTFGGAASIWIPMAITAAGGLLAMSVNATLKGGRYGYEDALKDLGMTIVQTATAGLASGLNIASTGGMNALKLAMTSTLVKLSTNAAPKLMTQALIGGATGAFGGAGNALFDDAAWDRGEWLSGIGHGTIKGFKGGFAGGALTGGLMKGGQKLGQVFRLSEKAMGNSGVAGLALRTAGGGVGGAASRAVEIDYDRKRGAYKGSSGQAMDEIWAAGVQNAVQSLGEGIGEGAAERSRFAGNMQRRHTDAIVISGGKDEPVTINRRPAANDNSDPATRQLWKDFDGPRKAGAANDPATKKSIEAEEALELPRPTTTKKAPEAETSLPRLPADAANDNSNDNTGLPLKTDDDGNVTTRLLLDAADSEPNFTAKSQLTDEAEGIAFSKKGADDDAERIMATFDPDKTQPIPKDAIDAALRPDLLDEYKAQQKEPPRRLHEHIDAYDGQIGRPIHDSVDLSQRDLTRLGHMPQNSRITASDPKSLDAAMHNYKMLMAHDRNREVLLVQNKSTGEYMVVQGGPTSVTVPKGPWIVERHSHPKIIDTDLNDVLVRSIPSGKPGDVGTVMAEVSDLLAGTPTGTIVSRRSVIDIQVSDAQGNITTHQTSFGVIGNGPDRIIWVEYRNPKNGNAVESHTFASLAEYEGHVLKTTGVDLTKQGADAVKTAALPSIAGPAPALHGAALSTKQRADIDFVAGRMAMHDDFNQQVQGLKAKGDLDPHLGRAATLEDAHARVKAMGLVGEPDSMIRLYNILNDPDIPASVSALIADITMAATKRHMIETGQLAAGEPLLMLFHGTNRDNARNITENGFSKASSDSGFEHDFSGGTYFTQHLESAEVYAGGRKNPDGGRNEANALNGIVIPYIVRGRNLGEMIDVRTGGAHRAAWVDFVTKNQGLFDQMRVDPEHLRRPETLQALIEGKPFPFGTFDAEGRGKVFNAFLESLAQPHNRPDIIFGDLGGPLTSGKQFRGGITDQAAVRSPHLIDLLNDQHMRQGVSQSAEETGVSMRTIGTNDQTGKVMNSLLKATDGNEAANLAPTKPVQAQVDRLAPHYTTALKAALEGLPRKLRTQIERDMHRLNMIDQAQFIKMILEPDPQIRQKALFDLSAEQLGKQMETGKFDWDFIAGTVRNLIVIEGVIGPNLRYMADHIAAVTDPNFVLPSGVPAKFANAVKESPFLISIAKTNPEILQDFEATFFKKDKNRVASAKDVQASLLASKSKLAKSSNDAKIKDAAELVIGRGDAEIPQRLDYRDALEQAILVARKEVAKGPTIDAETPVSAVPKSFEGRMPVSAATDTQPGMIIDHPVHGRGTVTAVHADHVDVVFPGVGKLPQTEKLVYTDGQIFPARNIGSDKDLDVIPILDANARQQGQAEIDQVRKDEGFGPYLKKAEAGTVCIARAGKHESIGTNSTMSAKSATLHLDERAHLLKLMVAMGLDPHSTTKDPRFLHHAELASLINLRAQIKESGGVMPTVVEMHVDRATCNSCLKNLSLVAAYLGIEELRVYTRGNMGNDPPLILRARR